jgi:hypothetical protein
MRIGGTPGTRDQRNHAASAEPRAWEWARLDSNTPANRRLFAREVSPGYAPCEQESFRPPFAADPSGETEW